MTPAGPYPLPDKVKRPLEAAPSGTPVVNRDPSLSRAVERAMAGTEPRPIDSDLPADGARAGPFAETAPAVSPDCARGQADGRSGLIGSVERPIAGSASTHLRARCVFRPPTPFRAISASRAHWGS